MLASWLKKPHSRLVSSPDVGELMRSRQTETLTKEMKMYKIKCLECDEINETNHLDWSAIICRHCKEETYNPYYGQPSIYAALAGIDRSSANYDTKGYQDPSISLATGEKISLKEWKECLLFIETLIARFWSHIQKDQHDYADQLKEYIDDQCVLYFVDADKSIEEHYLKITGTS